MIAKQKETAGLCDTCKNCQLKSIGNGLCQPSEQLPYCVVKDFEVIPVPLSNKEGQILECDRFILEN